jgi:hypothetical protein
MDYETFEGELWWDVGSMSYYHKSVTAYTLVAHDWVGGMASAYSGKEDPAVYASKYRSSNGVWLVLCAFLEMGRSKSAWRQWQNVAVLTIVRVWLMAKAWYALCIEDMTRLHLTSYCQYITHERRQTRTNRAALRNLQTTGQESIDISTRRQSVWCT